MISLVYSGEACTVDPMLFAIIDGSRRQRVLLLGRALGDRICCVADLRPPTMHEASLVYRGVPSLPSLTSLVLPASHIRPIMDAGYAKLGKG